MIDSVYVKAAFSRFCPAASRFVTLAVVVPLIASVPAWAGDSDPSSAASAPSGETAQAHDEFSAANRLLFMTDHLANVEPPTELSYSLSRTGAGPDSFDDHLDLIVKQADDGTAKNVAVDFLSGERHRYVPDVPNAHGNPAVMMFLQNDVVEMAQRTGGSWRFFQRRIKLALQNSAQIEDTQANYDGHRVPAKKIVIQPFVDSGHGQDIASEIDKRYIFTLSDQVPGGVIEIRTEIPNADASAPSEKLTLRDVSHPARTSSSSEPSA